MIFKRVLTFEGGFRAEILNACLLRKGNGNLLTYQGYRIRKAGQFCGNTIASGLFVISVRSLSGLLQEVKYFKRLFIYTLIYTLLVDRYNAFVSKSFKLICSSIRRGMLLTIVPRLVQTSLFTFLVELSCHLIESSQLISVNSLMGLLVVFIYPAANALI